jgi:hypothetical protein
MYLGVLNNSYPVATINTSLRGVFTNLQLSANGASASVSVSFSQLGLENEVNQYLTQ